MALAALLPASPSTTSAVLAAVTGMLSGTGAVDSDVVGSKSNSSFDCKNSLDVPVVSPPDSGVTVGFK